MVVKKLSERMMSIYALISFYNVKVLNVTYMNVRSNVPR